MISDIVNWVSLKTGWLVGTRAHLEKRKIASRPVRRRNETDIQLAVRTINFENSFEKRYWFSAYLKRTIIVAVVVLLVTKPTFSQFMAFQKARIDYPASQCRERRDWVFFTICEAGNKRYMGILGGFSDLTPGQTILTSKKYPDVAMPVDSALPDTFRRFKPLALPNIDTGGATVMDFTIDGRRPDLMDKPAPVSISPRTSTYNGLNKK